MNHMNYYAMKGPGGFSPPDPDDRWEEIAERLESEYATGTKLREIVEDEFFDLNILPDLLSIYEGHVDDIPIASERLVRNLLLCITEAIQKRAKEDAIAEVDRMDDEDAEARDECRERSRENWP